MINKAKSYLLKTALREYGVTEIPGIENNPRILQYFEDIGQKWVQDDETAWCSAFLNWCCMWSALPYSGKLDARSWLNVGEKTTKPEQGDIAIFWRESRASWKGHVGIFINTMDDKINVLGGNQNNGVCIAPYPKHRLLEYRCLA